MMSAKKRGSLPEHDGKRIVSLLLFAAILVLAVAIETYAVYSIFTSQVTGSCDFFPRWVCARMLFLEGKSPYSLEVTHITQRGLYEGRLAREGEDQVAFTDPIYSTYYAAPLIFLPYPSGQAVWMVLLQCAVLVSVVLGMKMYYWRPPPWLLAATCVWAVLLYNSSKAILVGQYAVVVFLMVTLGLWALWSGRDSLSGVFLALSTVKPQMVFLLIPLVLIWAALKRRWSVLIGFFSAMLFLILSGMWLVPNWIFDSISGMQRYASYTAYGSPVWVITEYYFPFLGRPANILLSVAFLGYLIWNWRQMSSWTWSELSWGTGLALIVTKFVTPRTATTNYVVLMLPLLLVFRSLSAQVPRGTLYVLVFQAASVFGFWALFAATIVTERGLNLPPENPIMYLPLPIMLFIVFVVARDSLIRPDGPVVDVVYLHFDDSII
jgi:hypothetical protein